MRYFKDENNQVYAYEDDAPERYIKPNLIPIDKSEADSLTAPTAEQILQKEIGEAKSYLHKTDWITAKYNDEVVIKEIISKSDFYQKYKDIYDKRAEMREFINENEA